VSISLNFGEFSSCIHTFGCPKFSCIISCYQLRTHLCELHNMFDFSTVHVVKAGKAFINKLAQHLAS
jgi:hypothetical protein